MSQDPFVAEVRRIREEHAKQFGYNLRTIYDAFKQQESQVKCDIVSFSPKRIPLAQDAERDLSA
jgi:hypothetical protein